MFVERHYLVYSLEFVDCSGFLFINVADSTCVWSAHIQSVRTSVDSKDVPTASLHLETQGYSQDKSRKPVIRQMQYLTAF